MLKPERGEYWMYTNKDFGKDGDKVHTDKCIYAHGGKYWGGSKCEIQNMESGMEVVHSNVQWWESQLSAEVD